MNQGDTAAAASLEWAASAASALPESPAYVSCVQRSTPAPQRSRTGELPALLACVIASLLTCHESRTHTRLLPFALLRLVRGWLLWGCYRGENVWWALPA